MMTPLILVLDADNTLWDTNAVFAGAQLALVRTLSEAAGHPLPITLDDLRAVDRRLMAAQGAAEYDFILLARALTAQYVDALSAEAALTVALSGTPLLAPREHMAERALAAYSEALTALPALLPGAGTLLAAAATVERAGGAAVMIHSEGDIERIRRTLNHYLPGESGHERVVIGPKSELSFQYMASIGRRRLNLRDGDLAVMVAVGDALHRDIAPANGAGFHTIYVPSPFKGVETPKRPEERPWRSVKTLQEVPEVLQDLGIMLPELRTQLVMQPIGEGGVAHYRDTIQRGVHRDTLLGALSAEDPLRHRLAAQERWAVWGVVSSAAGVNARQWATMSPGDLVVFYLRKKLIARARVVATLFHPDLATALWGRDEDGRAWENMYVLDDVEALDIGVEQLQPLLGWGPAQWVRSFQVVRRDRAGVVMAGLQLRPPAPLPRLRPPPPSEPSDGQASRTVRREQRRLRAWLLDGRQTGTCIMCGEEYPERYLWAAHLKPRAKCTEAERADPSVVALMCKFGCDDLYEHGDVYVKEGVIQTRTVPDAPPSIQSRLRALQGRQCGGYSEETAPYFEWQATRARSGEDVQDEA